jgi:hypothetical protein
MTNCVLQHGLTKAGRTVLKSFVLFGAMSCSLLAQTFEVASVKPRDPSGDPAAASCSGGPGTKDPLLYRCVSTPIAVLASTAYNVSFQDMTAPQGFDSTLNGYDIQAVVPAGATRDEFRIMLQNLLTERFHMKCTERFVRKTHTFFPHQSRSCGSQAPAQGIRSRPIAILPRRIGRDEFRRRG